MREKEEERFRREGEEDGTSRHAQHGRVFTMGMHRYTLVARTLTHAQTLSKRGKKEEKGHWTQARDNTVIAGLPDRTQKFTETKRDPAQTWNVFKV